MSSLYKFHWATLKPKLHLWPSRLELRETSWERFMPTSYLQGLCTLPWTCLGFIPALTHSSRHHALIRNKQVYQNVFYRCMRSIQVLKYPLPNILRTEAEQVILWDCVTPQPRSHKTRTRLLSHFDCQKRHDWNSWPHPSVTDDSKRSCWSSFIQKKVYRITPVVRTPHWLPVSQKTGKHGGLNGSGPGHIPDLLLHILITQLIRPLAKVRKIQAATSIGQCTIRI